MCIAINSLALPVSVLTAQETPGKRQLLAVGRGCRGAAVVRLRDVGSVGSSSVAVFAQEISHAHHHHLDSWSKRDSWALAPGFLVGRSGVGPRNMYFQDNGHSCIRVSGPGALGDTGNMMLGRKPVPTL